MENTFINLVAQELVTTHKNDLHEVTVVLPNKRAKVFLEFALKSKIKQTGFSPSIISIEEFLQDITKIKVIDSVELLFEFYNVYQSCTPKESIQDFDKFSSWAVTLLQDFNEIDRYLLDPTHVLSYLKDIEDIKHWSLDLEKRTPLIENYLQFYSRLKGYHSNLYKSLKSKNQGYQGLVYREAINKLEAYAKNHLKPIVFAGFNALNAAEERIFEYFATHNKATIIWDIDQVFINDPYNEAGYFARKIISSWKYYKTNPFTGITNVFSDPKDIAIIGTPKSVGQAKIVGSIIEQLDFNKLSDTAIVLGDEDLLEPLLSALPDSVDKINITMGLPAKNNPIQIFFNKLFYLHTNAINRGSYVFYYKDLLEVLSHPIMATLLDTAPLLEVIKQRNITFISQKRIMTLLSDSPSDSPLFTLLFDVWENNALHVISRISTILIEIKNNLHHQDRKLTQVYLYTMHTVFKKLQNYFLTYTAVTDIKTLFSLYKQAVQLAEVSFEGEPLGGLQIMGVLESRTLDFENVIITSLNEGTLPAGKSTQSFIPYDVKLELGLPTYKEKDAIYAYHFYHVITRAQKVHLLYNTEPDGLDAGEKSRFITQIEIEQRKNHNVTTKIYTPQLPVKAYVPVSIQKTKTVQERLTQIAIKGFSPSSLTNYLRNPLQFYYQRVLSLSETEEVEENIAANTLGTIIHETLNELYTPYIGVYLSKSDLATIKNNVESTIQKQFEIVFAEGDILHGKNLLAYEVAKRNIFNLLALEEKWIDEGDTIKIIALEEKYRQPINHSKLPFEVILAGEVDRIEERNGKTRIIDYKTGKVEANKLVLSNWQDLLTVEHDKIIQLLAYAYMYFPNVKNQELEAGIISFKNLNQGFMPFAFKEGKDKDEIIDSDVLSQYIDHLVDLISEILDVTIPFEETVI